MVEHAIDQVRSYSHVKRTVAFAGEDVGAVASAHDCSPVDLWGDNVICEPEIIGLFEIPVRRTAQAARSDAAVRGIGMTEVLQMIDVVGTTDAIGMARAASDLRTVVGRKMANTPLKNNQAVAGVGTADGLRSMPPAMPGVPMSPEPKLCDASVKP